MSGWTPEEDATLTKLWNEVELSSREIGARLGKTRNAVIGRAHRLGLPLRGQPRGPMPVRGYGELLIRRKRDAEARKRRQEATVVQFRAPHKSSAAKQLIKPRGDCPPEVKPKGLSLADLKPHQCRWPDGDGPYTFCGHRVDQHAPQPYCAWHQWVGTKPTPALPTKMIMRKASR